MMFDTAVYKDASWLTNFSVPGRFIENHIVRWGVSVISKTTRTVWL